MKITKSIEKLLQYNFMQEKVLILGSKGMLGQELVRIFSDNDFDVVAWDKENLDLSQNNFSEKIFVLNPAILINASGYNKVDLAEMDEHESVLAYAVNSNAPKILAETAKEMGSFFVNYSTDYVFDGTKKGGYLEGDTPNPLSVYGRSKYLGEKNIQEVGGKYHIIRPARIFGKRGSGESKKSFVEIMLEKSNLPEIRVVNDERGSITYAPDLAEYTLALIKNNADSGIYHGANSGSCSWFEWAEEIFKLTRKMPKLIPISSSELNNPAKRPADSTLLTSKTKPQRPWRDALEEFLQEALST